MDQREDLYAAQRAAKERAATKLDAALDHRSQLFATKAADTSNAQTDAIAGQSSRGLGSALNSLLENLSMGSESDRMQAERKQRAVVILLKHPEFEDFLWLLRSGLV